MEYAFKMFNQDLTCTKGRGKFQYHENEWMEEEEANCVRNGFHCAKNPLDCLSYYPDWDSSVCYVVEIGGDIDEDAWDSKISCTKIRLIHPLTLSQFVAHSLWYIMQHPLMPDNVNVKADRATAGRNHFAIARGKDPAAKGKLGDAIGILKEKPESREIEAAGSYRIDGRKYLPDVWYDVEGRPRTDEES